MDNTEGITTNNINQKVTLGGLLTKTIIFLIIAIGVTMFSLNNIGPVLVGWTGLILSIILGFIFYGIYRILSTTTSSVTGILLSSLNSIILGVLAGNSIYVITYYISRFAEINLDIVNQALMIALLATITVVVGGIVCLPFFKGKDKEIGKIMKIVFIMLAGYSVLYFASFFFALLGLDGLWNIILTISFGNGPIGIIFSLLMVAIASWSYIKTLSISSSAIDRDDKIKEYFYASMLVSSIINLFIEIFRLTLKILSFGD